MTEKHQGFDDGWIVENRQARPSSAAIERRIASRLPPLYRDARLSKFSQEIRTLVAESAAARGGGLLLTGAPGTGKTHLAAAVLRDMMGRGTDATFVTCERYYADLRKSYQEGTSEDAVVSPLERVPFLVLDDLGAESLSDHERRYTLALLDRRINANRPTIVTTNWGLEQIAELMDDRIASRLATFTMVELSGPDLRMHRNRGPKLQSLVTKEAK